VGRPSHENPLWRYYTLSEAEREQYHLTDLKNYLPPQDGMIRTLGVYKEDPDGKGGPDALVHHPQ